MLLEIRCDFKKTQRAPRKHKSNLTPFPQSAILPHATCFPQKCDQTSPAVSRCTCCTAEPIRPPVASGGVAPKPVIITTLCNPPSWYLPFEGQCLLHSTCHMRWSPVSVCAGTMYLWCCGQCIPSHSKLCMSKGLIELSL